MGTVGVPGPCVLHVLACDDWGGTEVQIALQVIRWGDAGGVQCVALLAPPGPVHQRITRAGGQAWSVAGRWGALGAVVRLSRLIRRKRVDIIEAYGFKAGLVARAARAMSGWDRPRLVIGIHSLHFSGGAPEALRNRFVFGVERLLSPMVTCFDANSVGGRDFLVSRGFPPPGSR